MSEQAGLRAVFLAGFLSGPLSAALFMLASGVLLQSIVLDPIAVLGGGFGIGLMGLACGNCCGLLARLLFKDDKKTAGGWRLPIVLSCGVSALIGLLLAICIFGMLGSG